MSVVELGGPRTADGAGATAACSALRVRRWLAGELTADEAKLAEAHVAGCARCQAVGAEVEHERAELVRSITFEDFATGVAEKLAVAAPEAPPPSILARPSKPSIPPGWRQGVTWRALNVAASLAFIAGMAGVLWQSAQHLPSGQDPSGGPAGGLDFGPTTPLHDWQRLRTKGGAGLGVFALRAARSFSLREGEKAQAGDRLLPALEPGGHSHVVVLLVEPGEVSVLYRGPARGGPLPEAFEWTGSGREARLVAVYADGPLAAEAVMAAVKAGRVAEGQGVEVVERRIER